MFFVVLKHPKVSGYATFTMPFQKTYLLNPMFRYHVATNIALQTRDNGNIIAISTYSRTI